MTAEDLAVLNRAHPVAPMAVEGAEETLASVAAPTPTVRAPKSRVPKPRTKAAAACLKCGEPNCGDHEITFLWAFSHEGTWEEYVAKTQTDAIANAQSEGAHRMRMHHPLMNQHVSPSGLQDVSKGEIIKLRIVDSLYGPSKKEVDDFLAEGRVPPYKLVNMPQTSHDADKMGLFVKASPTLSTS